MRIDPEALTVALLPPLPGAAAQERMAPRPRATPPAFPHAGPPRVSAVLILLYPGPTGETCLPLTQRAGNLAEHGGQISLPGGRQEPEDPTLWDTACREAYEEVGLAPGTARYLGALTPLVIPVSHFVVHPLVGYAPERPALVPNPVEVSALIELPLATLRDPAHKVTEDWVFHGLPMVVPHYRYEGHSIWGATAMMLSELEAVLERMPS